MAKHELFETAAVILRDLGHSDSSASQNLNAGNCAGDEDKNHGYDSSDADNQRRSSDRCGPITQTGPPGKPRLLNEYQAAERLGLSVKTLRRWRWAGRPPEFIKIGRAVRYDPAVIEDLIAVGRRASTSDPGQGASS